MPKQSQNAPRSVLGKTKLVLEQFSVEEPALSLTEISQRSNLPKPTAALCRRCRRKTKPTIWVTGMALLAQ